MLVVVDDAAGPQVRFTTSKTARSVAGGSFQAVLAGETSSEFCGGSLPRKHRAPAKLAPPQTSLGFDFGLKTFLTCSDGYSIESPQFFKQAINTVKLANRQHSKKQKGSHNRERARLNLVRKHEDIANRRKNWFWKLAHDLTDKFDVLCFETLNLKGMKRLWGRKISDLALGEFLQILEWVAKKKSKQIVYIDCWYPSTKTCHNCKHVLESLDLSVRLWRCPSCQIVNGRDENSAKNIQTVGTSTVGVGTVIRATPVGAA